MMQIVYFSEKEQFLNEIEISQGEKVFVAPSPAKADGLRLRLPTESSHDVITIAKFTSNLVDALWEGEDRPLVKRKSELLLIFGILKNKYFPELGFEQFNQAYNLFSDLRSFTLNQDALSSIMEEQPEIIKRAVLLFWQLLEVTGFQDEHGAYQQIAERLRSHQEVSELGKTYIFWGFQHLNGQQVDLLKALALRYTVILPFPLALKDKIKRSDWISWIKDNNTDEKNLALKEISPRATWLPVNSRELSLHLKGFIQSGDQIILGVSNLTPSHIDIVPSQIVSFKIPHQILENELREISEKIKNISGTHLEMQNLCTEEMKKTRTLKHYRVWQLYHEALIAISELTDDVLQIDSFFLKVLDQVVVLNQPRTSYVPVSSEKFSIELKDMSSLEDIDRKRRVILCVDERFDEIQSLGQNYTESIQKSLSVLGPLKRNELELLFKQWEFRDLFSRGEVIVLMNEGTLKHSLIWKRMFSGILLLKSEKNVIQADRAVKDHFLSIPKKSFDSTFSATKLQTYIDCPRRFYFNYIEKIFPLITFEKDFDPMISGTIVHEIIEIFYLEKMDINDLGGLTRRIMQRYIEEKRLLLPREIYLQRELVFKHRSFNGIQFLKKLEEVTSEPIDWKIEESFNLKDGISLKGRIDCIGVSSQYIFLLDFKSTESSAANSSEVVNLEAIQLWVYAKAAKNIIKDYDQKTIVLGYVVLDDSSKSNLITQSEDLVSELKAHKLCKVHKLKDEFSDKLKEADEKLMNLSVLIAEDDIFPPKPRHNMTCHYCELNKVCIKSEIPHV